MTPTIPQYPEMRPLVLEDGATFHQLFAVQPPQQSEFTFTNLYMWRDAYALRITRHERAVLVYSWPPDPEDSFLFPPLGEADETTVRMGLQLLAAAGHTARLARVATEDSTRLGLTAEGYSINTAREQWDYVYAVPDLINLHGNKYHDKRNHLEQFLRKYQYTYHHLTPELVPACQTLHERWCDEKHCDLYSTLRAEVRAVKEVLGNVEALGVIGGCIEVNGVIEAYTIGEQLNPETMVIHLEKANAAYHGLYQLINQQYLLHEWAEMPYVNREQDIGLVGLRRAKESYNPHHMVEKFEVHRK